MSQLTVETSQYDCSCLDPTLTSNIAMKQKAQAKQAELWRRLQKVSTINKQPNELASIVSELTQLKVDPSSLNKKLITAISNKLSDLRNDVRGWQNAGDICDYSQDQLANLKRSTDTILTTFTNWLDRTIRFSPEEELAKCLNTSFSITEKMVKIKSIISNIIQTKRYRSSLTPQFVLTITTELLAIHDSASILEKKQVCDSSSKNKWDEISNAACETLNQFSDWLNHNNNDTSSTHNDLPIPQTTPKPPQINAQMLLAILKGSELAIGNKTYRGYKTTSWFYYFFGYLLNLNQHRSNTIDLLFKLYDQQNPYYTEEQVSDVINPPDNHDPHASRRLNLFKNGGHGNGSATDRILDELRMAFETERPKSV